MTRKNIFFYFAYGSNLKLSEIRRSCPTAERKCLAMLPAHALVFPRKSTGRNCGVASVAARVGSEVWGGVYEISELEREKLESREGFKPNRPLSANAYVPSVLTVLVDGDPNTPLEVVTFIANPEQNPPLPSLVYKNLIIAGAHEWNVGAKYIAALDQIQTSNP